ncbi:hypothetical protein L228DRAFT_249643 [Xylona heveae TC161]|uniref:DUF803-domain-containing protein n=1 Tax=Xylona heveae (strain CBS 132557 / TC161) TaxID=1328760 RepID=A0A165FCP9_XYLHT|nr:hypothetical protein L228DRAFT_249643 [Xylona heveae TC161]KZF20828.1 hypothetical protein L228DRAFT_249643 [Xylona heveae TC161]
MGQLGDLSPNASVAVGVIVGLISTSVQSLGLTLQRKSHILEDEKAPDITRRPPHRRRRWQLGMLMFIISNLLGSSIQITTLPLPVLSTLQASGLVFNSICATLILGEPFTRWSLVGTVLVCAGAVLIATFGAIAEPAHTLDQLLALLGQRQFVLWMVGQAILVVLIIIGARCLQLLHPRAHSSARMRLARGMSYGAISGILSAHCLLLAKSAVELLVRTVVDRSNQFNRWQSWVILVGLVVLALTQLYYLHCGLKLCSTSVLYPFVFCIYNIIAILDGLIYFRQVSSLGALKGSLIALGTVILLSGVLALSWRLSDESVTKPPVAHSALGPGLGFVEEAPEGVSLYDDYDDDSDHDYTPYLEDEEAAIAVREGERQPLLVRRKRQQSHQHGTMDPTARDDRILSATRLGRQGLAEAAEIWDELDDQDDSLFRRRHQLQHARTSYTYNPRANTANARARAMSTPTKLFLRRSSRPTHGAASNEAHARNHRLLSSKGNLRINTADIDDSSLTSPELSPSPLFHSKNDPSTVTRRRSLQYRNEHALRHDDAQQDSDTSRRLSYSSSSNLPSDVHHHPAPTARPLSRSASTPVHRPPPLSDAEYDAHDHEDQSSPTAPDTPSASTGEWWKMMRLWPRAIGASAAASISGSIRSSRSKNKDKDKARRTRNPSGPDENVNDQ